MVRRRRALSPTHSSPPSTPRQGAQQKAAPVLPADMLPAKRKSLAANAGSSASPSLGSLLRILVLVEVFFLALVAVAPLGGVSQRLSQLARPSLWLLAPPP